MIDLTLLNTVLPYIYVTFIAYEVVSTLWRKYSQWHEARRIDNIQNIMASIYASFLQTALRKEYQPIDDSVRVRLNNLLNKNLSVEWWKLMNVAIEGITKRYFLNSNDTDHPVPIYRNYDFKLNPVNLNEGFRSEQPNHLNLDELLAGMQQEGFGFHTCGQNCDEEIKFQAFYVNVPQNDDQDSTEGDIYDENQPEAPTNTPAETPAETEAPAETPAETETPTQQPINLADSSANIPTQDNLNESIDRDSQQTDRPAPRFGARRFGAVNVVDHPLRTISVPPPVNN